MVRYNTIKYNDIANGDGVGVSIFFQGCHFHCPGCFNEETWDLDGGKEWTPDVQNEVLNKLSANGIQRHLSILGGEPLLERNIEALHTLCAAAREKYPGIKIYLWTGYTMDELLDKVNSNFLLHSLIFELVSVLITGRYEQDKRDITLKLRGSWNQEVWQMQ